MACFRLVRDYQDIVDLCVTAAQRQDPNNLAAVALRNSDSGPGGGDGAGVDPDATHYLKLRMSSYHCVTEAMTRLIDPQMAPGVGYRSPQDTEHLVRHNRHCYTKIAECFAFCNDFFIYSVTFSWKE